MKYYNEGETNVTIYIDILIITNVIINYFLILLTIGYTTYNTSRKNIFISSLIGGLSSLIMLLPKLSFLLTFGFKLLICFIIIKILFRRENIFKNYYIFLIINFIFSGLMMVLWFFISPAEMKLKNGVAYFNISTVTLILSISVAYLLIHIFTYLAKKVPIDIKDYLIEIYIDNKKIILTGFVDTGNLLCDFFSATPVIICRYSAIEKILPQELKRIIIKEELNDLNNNSLLYKYHIRVIPYQTINNQQFLLAFKPEKIVLKSENLNQSVIYDVYIGLTNNKITISDKYDVILNPKLIR